MPMYVDKFKSGTWKQGPRGGTALTPPGLTRVWIYGRRMKTYLIAASGLLSLLFTDAAAAETFFKAVPCDAMPSPLLSSDLPWPRGRLARLGEIINFDAKNRRRIGIGGRGRSMRRGGARRQGGIRICMFYSNFVGYGSEMELILLTRTTAQHCLHGN